MNVAPALQPYGASTDGTPSEPLHVLIAFDDEPAYRRALRLLARVVHEFGHDFEVRPLPWRFDALASATWRSHACGDAARSDILIISTTNTHGIPEGVTLWLEMCRAINRTTAALLVALLGEPGRTGEASAVLLRMLSDLAAASGLAFLAPQSPSESPRRPPVTAASRARAITLPAEPPTLDTALAMFAPAFASDL